jgi:hypothetical protein
MVSWIQVPLLLSHAQIHPSAQGFAGWLHADDEAGVQLAPAEATTQEGAASTSLPPVPPSGGVHSIGPQRQTPLPSQPHCIALQTPAVALSQSIFPHVQPLPHSPALQTVALIA